LPIPRLQLRYHAELSEADVVASNVAALWFESMRSHQRGWQRILARNQWFQTRALAALRLYRNANPKQRVVLFGYSYASRQLFEFARDAGWSTVLGQIDPGLMEERLVRSLHKNLDGVVSDWRPAPSAYWIHWKQECQLADHIVVNSEWSRHALVAEGVEPEKLSVIPLAYEPVPDAADFRRSYPERFTLARPMKVLFLGQFNVRKGGGVLMEAISQMSGEPIQFRIVGPCQISVPQSLRKHPQVTWIGSVPHSAAAREYQDADVFVFPTFSDGFGLTQLEAQAWKLPAIVSRYCGEVIRHFENGLVLTDVTAAEIVRALRLCIEQPAALGKMSAQSGINIPFTKTVLGSRLTALID
jgi:glycosyltransferase involved in cell wall biosynthesis